MPNMSFTNNAATTLASGITNVATSLTVTTSTGSLFPALSGSQYFYCTLTNVSGTVEIVKVTARSTDTFTIVRAQDNTSAVAWNSGDKVELRLVAANLNDFPKLDEANTFTGANAYGTPASIVLTNATSVPVNQATGTLPIANGGTGSTSASAALTALGAYPSSNPSGYQPGTVTSVATGNGLTGGTITTSGTISIAAPSVGSVGAYGLFYVTNGSNYSQGSTIGGGSIRYASAGGTWVSVSTPAGTWMSMSSPVGGCCTPAGRVGLFVRIS
jgi:hypothetical protein